VWRFDSTGSWTHDLIAAADEPPPTGATPLLEPVMRDGHPLAAPEPLTLARDRSRAARAGLPPALRRIDNADVYPVAISETLAARLDVLKRGAGNSG
jgi:nicotinate phosphoribosyltransferase